MTLKPNTIDDYIDFGCGRCEFGNTPLCKVNNWTEELHLLHKILKETDLIETIKWSAPCYTFQDKNVLMLGALKECVVLSFLRGAELDDTHNLLEKPGKNSEHARYIRFTSTSDITQLKSTVLKYIKQAITTAHIPKPKQQPNKIGHPSELTQAFENDSEFKEAFHNLTPGRQRSHLLHYTSAKQSKTITNRIIKSREKVISGRLETMWREEQED